MDIFYTLWAWFTTIGFLGAVVLTIFVAHFLRGKIEGVETHWEGAIMPSVALLLVHLGIYWLWPVFWVNWFNSNGFILMQLLIVVGLYTASLKTKPAGFLGKMLAFVAIIGISISVWTTFKATNPDFFKNLGEKDTLASDSLRGQELVVVTAKTEHPSAPILTPNQFSVYPEGPVWVYFDNGHRESLDPGQKVAWDVHTRFIRVQSRTTEPVNVTVHR